MLCISQTAYATASVSRMADEDPVTYRVKYAASPRSGGSIYYYESESRAAGDIVTMYANVYSNFTFKHWTVNGTVVSTDRNLSYTMPAHDVEILAVYDYNPGNPLDPTLPEFVKTHKVTLSSSPKSAGYFNYGSEWEAKAEDVRNIYAYSNNSNYFKFKHWLLDGEIVSTNYIYYLVMPDHDVNLVAVFDYEPGNPANPGVNKFNPATGVLTMDDFTPGDLYSAMYNALSKQNVSGEDVTMVTVYGEMDSNDCNAFIYLNNMEVLDFSHTTGLTNASSYAYNGHSGLRTVILPESLKEVEYYSFYNCKSLEEVVMHSTTPPMLNSTCFKNMCEEGTILYVPDEALEDYKALTDYTSRFINIYPLSQFEDIMLPSVQNVNFELLSTDTWNDINAEQTIKVSGTYTSVSGLKGTIKYSVDGGEWILLADGVAHKAAFSASVKADFSASKTTTHTLRVLAVDEEGQSSKIRQMKFYDISRLSAGSPETQYYDGSEHEPTIPLYDPSYERLTLGSDYTITGYSNNVNAGWATATLEGVFPNTIGTGNFNFYIEKKQLLGTITLDYTECDFDGTEHTPFVSFECTNAEDLVLDKDYCVRYHYNKYAGQAQVYIASVEGSNYTSSVVAYFTINRVDMKFEDLTITYPDEDVPFDEQAHGISIAPIDGAGVCSIIYVGEDGTVYNSMPVKDGKYSVSISYSDGGGYNAAQFDNIYSFSITCIDDEEWEALLSIYKTLGGNEWTNMWNLSGGKMNAHKLYGVTVKGGHVTGISLPDNGLKGTLTTEANKLQYLKSLNVSGNELTGDLGLIGSVYPALSTLIVSYNNFAEISNPLPESIEAVNMSHQNISQTIDINLADSEDAITAQLPSVMLYNSSTRSFNSNYSITLDNGDGWSMQIRIKDGKMDVVPSSVACEYHGKSGDKVNASNAEYSTLKARFFYPMGDVDFDGEVTASDLQADINYAFEQEPRSAFNFTAGDTYADEFINVQDVVCLVNILIGEADDNDADLTGSSAKQRKAVSMAVPQNADAYLYISNGKLILSSASEIAALDIHLNNINARIDWHISELGMMESANANHAVAYSLAGNTFPAGETVLADVTGAASVAYASLSDADAKKLEVAINVDATSIQGIAGGNAKQQIYNVAGQRTANTHKGVNIIRENGITKKVFINK